MGDPFPVTAVTFDGTSLQRADGSVILEIKRGLGDVPRVRGRDQVVPGLAGRIPRGRIADVLPLELEGIIEGVGATEAERRSSFVALRQEMRALFDPTKDPEALACVLEDGSTATINARCVPPLLWEERPGYIARLNVALESVDPDWDITPEP